MTKHCKDKRQRSKSRYTSKVNSAVLKHKIKYSIFDNYFAADVKTVNQTIGEFIGQFEKPVKKPYTLDYFNSLSKSDKSRIKNGRCFSTATYGTYIKPGKKSLRNDENVLFQCGIGLDFDNENPGNIVTLDTINERLKGLFYIVHPSHSSSLEKQKYRVILFFSDVIKPDRYPDVFAYFSNLFGLSVDGGTKDVCRAFLLPACPEDQVEHYFMQVNDGKLFDTSIVPILEPTQKQKRANAKPKAAVIPTNLPSVELDCLGISNKFKKLIRSGNASKYKGDRSILIFHVVRHLINNEVDDEKILAILFDPNNGIKQRPYEKGKEWVIEEIERIRSKMRYVRGVAPHFPDLPTIIAKKANQQLRSHIELWLKSLSGNLAIKASAGIGKTQAILELIKDYKKGRMYEIYVPTHDLANELLNKLNDIDPTIKAKVIQGRSYKKDSTDIPLCDKPDSVQRLPDYGYSVYNNLCKSCELFKKCPYLAQYTDNVQVRIFTHASIPLDRGLLDDKYPNGVIIDEAFYSSLMDFKYTNFELIDRFIKNEALRSVLINSLENKLPLLAKLTQAFGDEIDTIFEDEIKGIKIKPKAINGKMSDIQIIHLLDKQYSIPEKQVLVKMLTQLQLELEMFPKRKHAISVRHVDGNVIIADRKLLTRFTKPSVDDIGEVEEIPVLLIDADYCQRIVKRFLPNVRQVELRVERNSHVTQIYSAVNSRMRFKQRGAASNDEKQALQKQIDNTNQVINMVRAKHGDTLVVGYKFMFPDKKGNAQNKSAIFSPEGDYEYTYFGGLRGSNDYSHCKAVVIIGRNQLPAHALESQAAALWWDSKKELNLTGELKQELRGYRAKNEKLGVWVDVCADPRTQLLMEMQRERETLQAIDRLRLMFNKDPKHVYVLSNVPLDITVDCLVTQTNLRTEKPEALALFEQALGSTKQGVLPVNPSYLVEHCSGIFSSIKQANKALKVAGIAGSWNTFSLNPSFYNEFINRKWNLIEFTAHGKSKKPFKAIACDSMTTAEIKRQLSQLFDAKITIREQLIRHKTLDEIIAKPSELDDFIEQYYRSPQEYCPRAGGWIANVYI